MIHLLSERFKRSMTHISIKNNLRNININCNRGNKNSQDQLPAFILLHNNELPDDATAIQYFYLWIYK